MLVFTEIFYPLPELICIQGMAFSLTTRALGSSSRNSWLLGASTRKIKG